MSDAALDQRTRIEELQFRLDLERFVTSLSVDLIGAPTDRIDELLSAAIEQVGRLLHVDHCFVLLFSDDCRAARQAYSWTDPVVADRVQPLRERLRYMTTTTYPNALQARLVRGLDLFVPSVDMLPDAWAPERQVWQREGLRSIIGVPVKLGEDVLGALGVVSIRVEQRWSNDVVALIRRIAQLFANALERKRTSRALERQSQFGRIAVGISRALAFAPPSNIHREIERAMQELARVLNAGEAHVFVGGPTGAYAPLHIWLAKPDAPLRASIARIDYASLPWWSKKHLAGETIVLRSQDSLPPAAVEERALAESLGFAAVVDAPLVDEGRVFGVCGVASATPRAWTREEASLVTLVAELIGQALQHQRARDALRQSEERFQSAVEGTSDGLWNWPDISTNEAWWSSRLYELLGYEDGEIPASRSSFEARVHPEDLPRLRSAAEMHVARGDALDVELRLRPKQGDYIWVRLRGRAVRRDDGTVRMAGSVQNIGEQKEAEAQLLHAQRMESVGVLAGGVAHDFNNLLTAIQNYARLSLRYVENKPERAREALDGILTAGDRAATLTRQLLAFSRRQIIHRRTLDLNALIAELVGMLRRLIPESISIEFNPGYPLDAVDVDPGQLEQVLVNLCVNARDAMLEGGKLRITTENTSLDEEATRRTAEARPGRYVRLTVMDTGLGMSREVVDRAFEPFFTTKERGKGTGLGLSTVYGIVRQHGGLVELESYEGAGTAVRVLIPSVEQSPKRRESNSKHSAQGGSELILVAEDNDLVRRILVQLLEEAGYRVVVARDGIEAIQRFEERPAEFDLLFLDVIMPKMSGRDAYECIRKSHDVKVVFCSGYSGGVFEDEFFREAHRRLIPKPYDVDVLLSTVREVLDAP